MKKEKTGRVVLTARERQLSVNALRRKIEKAGFYVSRVTSWRAKVAGHFWPNWHTACAQPPLPRRSTTGWVVLNEGERDASNAELRKKFGITGNTAARAMSRGWFEVNALNARLISDHARERLQTTAPHSGEHIPKEEK